MPFPDSIRCIIAALSLATPVICIADDERAPDAAVQAFVQTSYLIAPRQVGDFVLEASSYDPQRKPSGAGFRYTDAAHPQVRIDVYVYPAGRLQASEAMEAGMQAFRADIDQARAAGTLAAFEIHADEVFDLRADIDQVVDVADAHPDDPYAAAVLEAVAAVSHPAGRRLGMTITPASLNAPMYSAGYLFYRQLYYFKLRASAPRDRIEAGAFRTLADQAARTLVPAIEAAHVGTCASATIVLDPDARPEDSVQALIRQTAAQQGYNCHHQTEGLGLADRRRVAEVIEIDFAPDEWGAP